MLPAVYAAEIEDIRMWRAPDHTRLVFDLSGAIEHSLFTLDNPRRVVIDLKRTDRPEEIDQPDFSDTPITAMRTGVRNGSDLRVVLDMGAEVRALSFTLAPNAELSDRLVVDLYDLETSPAAALGSHQPRTAEAPVPDERRDIVVAISAGHGGEDPGAISPNGLQEKVVALSISRKLKAAIEAVPGYRAVMIRDGDYYVNLKQRPQIARENRADLFLAVHADSFRSSRPRGITIFALSGDRADRENARRVAEKENSADLLGGVGGDLSITNMDDDVALTLVSLQMEWSMEQSLLAGTEVLEAMAEVAYVRKDKVQQASLQVLNSPDIPSMLIETGFLSNAADERNLRSSAHQNKLAAAIARGVRSYFYAAPPPGTLVAYQKANGIVPVESFPGEYRVSRGDSLSEIAERFGTTVAALRSSNGLRSNTIQIGQILSIPGAGGVQVSEHEIRRGETLSEIAQRYGVSLARLREANNISNDRILVGQVLRIPTI